MVNKIIINNSKKKKIKRLSANRYYATAFISNPCDQLFGPPLDSSLPLSDNHRKETSRSLNNSLEVESSVGNSSITNSSISETNLEDSKSSLNVNSQVNGHSLENNEKVYASGGPIATNCENKFEYIPTPKWNKMQTCILEELFKKSRYPKPNELKSLSQRLNVMDNDVEVIPETLTLSHINNIINLIYFFAGMV
jgi:hypothetical protein